MTDAYQELLDKVPSPEVKLNRLLAKKTLLADQQKLLAEQQGVVDDKIAAIQMELTIEHIGELPGPDDDDGEALFNA